jgi:hypothetical protein
MNAATILRLSKRYADKKAMRRMIPVTKPAGFSWDAPINIWTDGMGRFETDFDVSAFRPVVGEGKTYYVNRATGNNVNDGLTPSTAVKSIANALGRGDAAIVYVAPGVYDRSAGWGAATISRDVSVLKYGDGDVIISHHDVLTWTLAAGQAKTYRQTRSGVQTVWDAKYPDANGDYQKYTNRASIAEVEANPGSWYNDGTYLYVQPSDSRVPDADIRAYLGSTNCAVVSGAVSVYVEGIKFHGGSRVFQVRNTGTGANIPNFYGKGCEFNYGSGSDAGLAIQGAAVAYLQDCVAAKNNLDGFNYHILDGVIPKAIEVNCIGRDNGNGSGSDNGSTMHDGGAIVRVNGAYYRNYGGNVADASSGSQSWNLGCVAFNSTLVDGSDFIAVNGAVAMWLDSCLSYGSAKSLSDNDATATINVRNFRAEKPESMLGTKNFY